MKDVGKKWRVKHFFSYFFFNEFTVLQLVKGMRYIKNGKKYFECRAAWLKIIVNNVNERKIVSKFDNKDVTILYIFAMHTLHINKILRKRIAL